jgi:hypothetical protein
MRDDFSEPVKLGLAKRAGFRCSNPDCRQPTSGPQSQESGAVNIGVAAHITAAAPGGPRYDSELTPEERRSAANGVWLCQTCARLPDVDVSGYSSELLREWKYRAEATAFLELRGLRVVPDRRPLFRTLESEMPNLFAEMRAYLEAKPFCREFVLCGKRWSVNADPNNPVLAYYFEDHPELRQKIRVLENHGLVTEITYNNLDRFSMSEDLVDYLKRSGRSGRRPPGRRRCRR